MMNENTAQLERAEIELPATAPSVRVTAGVGSAGQKTWNLRRPVTLIGSKRPAHIVLHDQDVSNAHCVLVNTGREILLKDLQTSSGTFCNKERINLTVLKDGDNVRVGNTTIQVAIRVPEDASDDSGCGLEYVDPTKFAKPIKIRLEHTDTCWNVEDAVVLVGRHERALVRIDHDDIARRHLVVFRFGDGPAVFDLDGKAGMTLNGGACGLAAIRPGDRVGVGPCTLAFDLLDSPAVTVGQKSASSNAEAAGNVKETAPAEPDNSSGGQFEIPTVPTLKLAQPKPASRPEPAVVVGSDSLERFGSELDTLQKNIAESWDRLNRWQEQLREDSARMDQRCNDLATREAEVDARDAAMRGQLHDLTRFHEQITEREKELARRLSEIQREQDKLVQAQAELVRREGDVARRNDELQRREHVLAQRWARLLAATCPHCGRSVRPPTQEAAQGQPVV